MSIIKSTDRYHKLIQLEEIKIDFNLNYISVKRQIYIPMSTYHNSSYFFVTPAKYINNNRL